MNPTAKRYLASALIFLSSALLLVCASAVFAGEQDKLYVCCKLAKAPSIDGVVDPSEWVGTDGISDFAMTFSGAAPPVGTTVRVGYDSKKLYFAAVCRETNPEGIVAKARNRDGDVWIDDCVELALDPPHKHQALTKFLVNSIGTVADLAGWFYTWDAAVEVAAGSGEGFWTVEVAVPFGELNRATPKPGEVWGFNVFRERYASGKQELINWAEATGNFMPATHAGHMVFDAPAARIPKPEDLHRDTRPKLTPELARHAPLFEGAPWTAQEIRLAEEQSLASNYETPHINMAGGPRIRALAFIRIYEEGPFGCAFTRVRDMVELMQRFPVDADAVFVGDKGIWGGKASERRLRALLSEKHDVFIFSRCTPVNLPDDAAKQVEAEVAGGAGILLYGSPADWLSERASRGETPQHLVSRLPIDRLACYEAVSKAGITGVGSGGYPFIATYQLDKGRAALVQQRGDANGLAPVLPANDENLVEYDYWIGFTGFALAWCAGREPAVTLGFPGLKEIQFARQPTTIRVAFESRPGGTIPVKAEVLLRDAAGKRTKLGAYPLSLGVGGRSVRLPRLAYGTYYLEARAWRGAETVGFGATKFAVTGDDFIPKIEIEKDFYETGETITGKFATAHLALLDSPRVRAELVTQDGRVLARRACGPKDNTFSFKIGPDTSVLMRAQVTVLDRRGLVQTKSVPFTVPNRRHGQFNFIMWDTPADVHGVAVLKLLAQAGFNVVLMGKPASSVSMMDCAWVPYMTRILATRDKSGIATPGCWNDEAYVTGYLRQIADEQPGFRKTGAFVYSLGDENDTFGCCVHPACLDAYRQYLKEVYGTVEALNASWGADYASFDEVQLMEGDDLLNTSAAFASGNYPRWCDRQMFARRNYLRLCARFADKFREIDPKAITGFEGAGRFGDDVDGIYESVGMWTTYQSTIDEIIRTTRSHEMIHGNWIGYTKDAASLIAAAWQSICAGANSIWWWRYECFGSYRGFLNSTLGTWPATEPIIKEWQVLRDGLGQLLLDAHPSDDGVALFYSVPSAIADQIPTEATFGGAETAHAGVIRLLKDACIQFRYVTPKMIAAGALGGVNALILPRASSIDEETAEAIREFVRRGGILVADLRAGIYDEHLKLRDRGVLDDVFGVKRAGSGRLQREKLVLDVESGTGLQGPYVRADADCVSSPARSRASAGQARVVFVNKFGKGTGILLNFDFGFYESVRDAKRADRLRRLVSEVLEQVKPRATVRLAAEKPELACELGFWRDGGTEIMSLRSGTYDWGLASLASAGEELPSQVEINLAKPKYVYDLRGGRRLGRVSRFTADLRTGRANFYGLLDKPIATPKLALRTGPSQGATALTAAISIPDTDTAVRLRLIDPVGNRPKWAVKVAHVRGGRAVVTWQMPANQPGRWKVEARELFSGAVVVKPVSVGRAGK